MRLGYHPVHGSADPRPRQLRLVRLQPGPGAGRARGVARRLPKRRHRRGRHPGPEPRRGADLAWPGTTRGRGRVAGGHPPAGRGDPPPRGLPRPPVHRPGLRRIGRRRPPPDARQDLGDPPRRAGDLRRTARSLRGHPVPLARRQPRFGAQGADRDGHLDRRGDHGTAPPGTARRGRPVPSRVGADRLGTRPAGQLPGPAGG